MNQVYEAALTYLRAGWVPTPVVSKVPVLKDWPTNIPSEADVFSHWGEGKYDAIGIVCGAPSGNLLVIDIEGRMASDEPRLAAVYQAAVAAGVGDLLGAAMTTACATTPSGGRHLFLRCTDGPVPGNVKLCYARDAEARDYLLAETRGAGGQVAAWPAPGREWVGASGPGVAIPVTSVQLGLILDAFRSIDEATRLPTVAARPQSTAAFDQPRSLTVAQALNDALMAGEMSWGDVLDPGWTCTGYDRHHGYSLWLRPDYGDKSNALSSAHGFESATDPRPVFVVHSNSVRHLPTGEGQRLTPGRVLAYCAFEGNEAAAYAALEQAVTGGEVHPAIARIPVKALERVVQVVTEKLPKPSAPPALTDGRRAAAPTVFDQPSTIVDQPALQGTSAFPGGGATTWSAVDLTAALSGTWEEDPPEILHRVDGAGVFYKGKVNGLIGESESGKTWVGLWAVREVLKAGLYVCYIDFEDGPRGVVARLRSMGVTVEELHRLAYVRPDEAFNQAAAVDLGTLLDSADFEIVIVDGVNAAFTLMGFDINSNNDASAFYQRLLQPIAKRGPGVITIDHVPKSTEARGKGGIGAGAKRGMGDGTFIRVEALEPFGKGQTGRLRLTVDKDRPGQVREVAQEAKFLGIVELISDPTTHAVRMIFHAPQANAGAFRPTVLMQKVSDALALMPEGASKRTIEGAVSGKAETIRAAIQCLQDEGFIELVPGDRRQIWLKLVKPFNPNELPEPEMEAIARRYEAGDDE